MARCRSGRSVHGLSTNAWRDYNNPDMKPGILEHFTTVERQRFAECRPRSRAAHERRAAGFYAGVPLHWMLDWPMPFPLIVAAAKGSVITDIDGIELADFCFGDSSSISTSRFRPLSRMSRTSRFSLQTRGLLHARIVRRLQRLLKKEAGGA